VRAPLDHRAGKRAGEEADDDLAEYVHVRHKSSIRNATGRTPAR
jgi:hypothetical protein